jgi:hypothetical protein
LGFTCSDGFGARFIPLGRESPRQAADRPQPVPFVLDATLDITFKNNKLAGGLLFGGGSPPGETSSDFGRDTRGMSGTIRLERTDHGENPNFIDVTETVVFNYYTVDDALDFCPGNTSRLTDAGFEGMAYNDFSRT